MAARSVNELFRRQLAHTSDRLSSKSRTPATQPKILPCADHAPPPGVADTDIHLSTAQNTRAGRRRSILEVSVASTQVSVAHPRARPHRGDPGTQTTSTTHRLST